MNRFRWVPAMIVVALLTGCIPKNNNEVVQDETESEVETTIIPNMQLSDNYYRTLIPYKESASRGLVVSNVYTKYDVKEVEEGLMRLSQNVFDTEKYYFQEGQYLDADTVSSWLARSNQTDDGLNPPADPNMDPEVRAKKVPVYLSHIVEQNYLVKTDDNKVTLGGISIGLALNSIYYYQKEQYGDWYEEPIPEAELQKKGKEIAATIVSRLRARSDIGSDVPIVVGLFKQNSRNSITPGTYFAYSVAEKGKKSLSNWKKVEEEYVTFPMSNPEDIYREMNKSFQNFKQDVDEYFSNYTSVVGTGFYKDRKLQKVIIEIPIQFYGKTEIIGFTQYLSGIVMKRLPDNVLIEISITSINGAEALLLKKPNEDEPFVHIYE